MVKVAALTGAQLDYWVARAEGHEASVVGTRCIVHTRSDGLKMGDKADLSGMAFHASTEWRVGGSIIERERPHEIESCNGRKGWYVRSRHRPCDGDQFYGDTLLVAAMRAYVASKFGPEVPDEK